MFLIDEETGECFEVEESDCEFESDGSGFWYLADDSEDSEEFYELVDADDYEDDAS